MIVLPIPQEVWPLISQALSHLAEQVGGPALKQRILALLHQDKLQRQVTAAISRAYRRFEKTVRDRSLLDQLTVDGQLLEHERIAQLLAQIATSPLLEEEQTRSLARELHRLAPDNAMQRCLDAATILISYLHEEIASIPDLRSALLMLTNLKLSRAIEQSLPLPSYAPGLRETVVASATQVMAELGHGSVTAAHLLYALTVLPRGAARTALDRFDISAPLVRQALKDLLKPGVPSADDPLTRNAAELLREAQRLARRYDAAQTHSEHLLMALLERAEGESDSVTEVFKRLGKRPGEIRDHLLASVRCESALQSFTRIAHRGDVPNAS